MPVAAQQRQNILAGKQRRGDAGAAEHAVDQVAFGLLHLHNAFLDRVLGDELVHGHGMLLANTMRAVGRLVLRRHVPPRVIVDDHVGRRQVEATPPALSEIKKTGTSPAWNCATILARLSLDEAPVSLRKADVFLGQALTDDIEHTRKLAEQQDAMPAVECAVHELHTRIELGAPRLVILVV